MDVEINALGVVFAAIAAMVVGSLWYSPQVQTGKDWMKLVKPNEKRAKKEMPMAMGVAAITSLITAYVLAHVTYLSYETLGNSYVASAVTTAFWIWFGFQFTNLTINSTFEQRPRKLLFINLGGSLVTVLAMGLVIGYVGL